MNIPFLFVLSLAIFAVTFVVSNIRTTPNECNKCRTSGHCIPPNCSCCGHTIPGKKSQRPQLVYFSFDDAVTVRNTPLYDELFNENRTNPNKCPITMTLFVSHNDTDYSLVKQLYEKGMDIAVHGINHIRPANALQFSYEALGQRLNLANNSQIPKEEIVGFRSPYLIPYGNEQYEILNKAGFLYDSSLTITKRSLIEESPVPFTMDYGWPYFCSIPECPSEHIKGFWEVPIVSVIDKLGRYPCVYIDGCAFSPTNEEESFNFLLENFMSYYTMNKAPFGLNMHSTWLLHEYETNPYRMKAMKRFLDYILDLDDVYIVNMKQLIEWMKYQPKLNELSTFAPFQCQNQSKSSNTENQSTTSLDQTTSLLNQSSNLTNQIQTARNQATGSSYQSSNSRNQPTALSNNPITPPSNHPTAFSSLTAISPNKTNNRISVSSSSTRKTRVSLVRTSKMLRTTAPVSETTVNMVTTQNTSVFDNNESSMSLKQVNTQNVSRNYQPITSPNQSILDSSVLSREVIHSTSLPLSSTYRIQLKNVSLTSEIPLTGSRQSSEPLPTAISHEQSSVMNFSYERRRESTNIRKTRNLHHQMNSARHDSNQRFNRNPFLRNSGLFRVATSLVMKNDRELEKIITKDSSNHDSAVILVAKNNPSEEEPQILTDMDYREPVILIHNRQQRLNYESVWDKYDDEQPTISRSLSTSKMTDIHPVRGSKISSSKKATISSSRNEHILSSRRATTTSPESEKHLMTKFNSNRHKASENNHPVIIPASYLKSAQLPDIGESRTFSADSLDKHLGLSNNKDNSNSNYNSKRPSTSNDESNASVPEFCRQGDNCKRPNCQCPQFHINTSKKIPQFVYFTYEGPVNSSIAAKLKELFHGERLNANGCRVKGTMFITSEGSNYTAVKELYDEGMEIALHGLKMKNLASKLLNIEISLQKYLLKRYANISGDKIVGWRNTDLQSKGNVQFQNLKDRNMLYDSSMFVMTNLENRTGIWPSTLDFGWKNNCLLQRCPTKNFKGLWEIPAVPYVGIKKRYLCKFVDSCYNKPRTAVQTYDLLLSNFMSFYKRDRTPFGVRLRTDWFLPGNEENLKGLNAFLGLVEELSDVYIVNVKGLIDWMKDPVIPADESISPSKIGC